MTRITVKKPAQTDQSDDGRAELNNLFTAPENEDNDVSSLMTQLEAVESANVKVYRVTANNKLAWLFDIHPQDFKMQELRDEYGGGKFRIFIYEPVEGRLVLRSSRNVEIEAPKRNANIPIQQAPNNDVMVLAQAMMESMKTGFESLGALIVKNNQPAIDPMTMQTQMLNQMMMMKQIIGGGDNSNSAANGLEMFKQGIQLAKEITPPAIGDATGTDVLLEAVKNLAPVLIQAQTQQQPAQQINPQNQAPVVLAPKPLNESQKMFNMKKMYLNMACDKAQKGADVALYADLVADNLPESELLALLSSPNPVEELAKIEPRVLQHREWFGQMVNELNQIMVGDAESDENFGIDSVLTGSDNSVINADNQIPAELADAIIEHSQSEQEFNE